MYFCWGKGEGVLESKQFLGSTKHKGNSILEELNTYSLVMGTITREMITVYKYLEGLKMKEMKELFQVSSMVYN